MGSVPDRPIIQSRIGRFLVERPLGSGLQGSVYLAVDPDLQRKVAVKILKLYDKYVDAGTMPFCPSEARIVARLAHPNIIPLYEIGLHKGRPYLVFAYVDGTTLGKQIRGGNALPVPDALALFRPVLDGMAYAHAQGVVHLDLSPSNIMLEKNGVPRIMDFGLAKLAGRDGDNPAGDDVIGTPFYMSPEHFNGEPLTPRTDVFALGLILYELLVGRPAFKVGSLHGVIRAIAKGELNLDVLEEIGLDPDLQEVLRHALSHDASHRYADAGEMKRALDHWCETVEGGARPHGTVEFLLRRMQRKSDFPALTNNLLEINRLTDESSVVSADTLAKVVLRDYAVTNKLLKLANSSFYGRAGQGVKTVSRAICLLGLRRVRMTCNGLMYFQHLKTGQAELQDALVSSFVSALLARHLASQTGRRELAEEAFICGLFHNLGKSLCIFYFAEEYREIARLCTAEGLPEETAAQRVLGIAFGELGVAVAATWKFPDTILYSMRYPGPGILPAPADVAQSQQQCAAFANELCELAAQGASESLHEHLDVFVGRFDALVTMTPEGVVKLLNAALDKFAEFAPVLGIDARKSGFIAAAERFVKRLDTPPTEKRRQDTPPIEEGWYHTTTETDVGRRWL